jgi:hypothetical protein
MSKNTGLGASLIFSGGRRRRWVAGISEWVPVGPTSLLGAPCGLVAHRCTPLGCVQCQKFLNILEKIILNFQGILRTFIFRPFFYCTENSKNRIIMAFYFILLKITESKRWVQKVVLTKFIDHMPLKKNPLIRLIKSY